MMKFPAKVTITVTWDDYNILRDLDEDSFAGSLADGTGIRYSREQCKQIAQTMEKIRYAILDVASQSNVEV